MNYTFLALFVTFLLGVISYLKWKLRYWDKKGLPTIPPKLPFGNLTDVIFGRKSFGEQFVEFYQILKAKGYRHGGIYFGASPLYVPTDPEIVKHIMLVDFAHFSSHGGYVDEESDPLSGHLFNLDDIKWRNLRVKLTPTFTSGKMKMMFQTLAEVSYNLKNVLDESVINKTPVDARDVLSRFGVDVISSVAFGLECDSLKDPNVSFRKYGKKAVDFDIWVRIKLFMQVLLPHCVLRAIGHKFTKTEVEEFFMKSIRDVVEYREKNNIFRKDFMHLLIQLKNLGTVTDDGQILDETSGSKEVGLTMNQVAAQAFVFFMAGYETSSSTITFALYELAMNPPLQDKLRDEINTILAKHDNKLTYAAMMEMTYMEKVIQETLRKYPPLPIIMRLCTKDYVVPGTDIEIKKGVGVMIPVLGLQTDPEYFPDPDVFDPDRFSEEKKKERPGFTWLPFGDGPRICIGMRFGMLQSKVALTTFIRNYRVKLNEKTKIPLKIDKGSFTTRAEGGVWLNLEKLN
ncbi:cytochrome P450 6A1 [Tribolium castaneum]|uniref:Cytochrome P450 6BQ1 n=1 Tax=Tribolium castaneum TaxID=7070 RepID=D2A0A4_TRICA|nr:PREDICTED: cytochrome P450 6A1 [Tribolium castaneum]EFA02816.1 cytochrome P450 6BQ1 [Tribolium castaneum]|eukprot:XP_008192266.1 PREDICTED: cytochrome P450 6A1 [Tribolium castaneum]